MPSPVLRLVLLLTPPPRTRDASASVRERILGAVRKYPGLGAADLARQVKTSLQLAEYHLHALQKAGLVSIQTQGRQRTHFPVAGDEETPIDRRDRPVVAALRRPMALRIALQLLENGSMAMGDLAASCGISPATATHHVKKMEKAGVLEIHASGRSRNALLADGERLRRLLIDHPPPRDVVSDFIDLWERVDI